MITEEPEIEQKYRILTVKTSIGHERDVADAIYNKTKKDGTVSAILYPVGLRGYLFVESNNKENLQKTIKGITHVRGLINGFTALLELEKFMIPKPVISKLSEGDIVEIIAGPFKGEKARIKYLDIAKEEITIELFEALVPIPITIKGDHVRLFEKK